LFYFLQNLRGWSNIYSDRSKLWLIQHWRPHIDSRVNIIDNERPWASPCDLLLDIVRVL
jgi:hypothetical protein